MLPLHPQPPLPCQWILCQLERAREFREVRVLARLPRPLTPEARSEMLDQLLDLRSGTLIRSLFDFGEGAHGAENRVPGVQAQVAASARARISTEESGEPEAGLVGS